MFDMTYVRQQRAVEFDVSLLFTLFHVLYAALARGCEIIMKSICPPLAQS
jgi:hypothetical protein